MESFTNRKIRLLSHKVLWPISTYMIPPWRNPTQPTERGGSSRIILHSEDLSQKRLKTAYQRLLVSNLQLNGHKLHFLFIVTFSIRGGVVLQWSLYQTGIQEVKGSNPGTPNFLFFIGQSQTCPPCEKKMRKQRLNGLQVKDGVKEAR